MRVTGLWSGHDASFCNLDDGVPTLHAELERYTREKEPAGDSIKFMMDVDPEWRQSRLFVTAHPAKKLQEHAESYAVLKEHAERIWVLGHHQTHAAHAFYSSHADNAIVFTFDGGGVEEGGQETATTVWHGKGKKLESGSVYPMSRINIGGLWTRVTRYVFQLQSGWPLGHQAGTVMAMAAMGDPKKYTADFRLMLRDHITQASMKPSSQPRGALVPGKDPRHPYLDKYAQIAMISEQERFDLAAGLQAATEELVQQFIGQHLWMNEDIEHICIAGGVSLNSVCMGKIREWFPRIKSLYIPPVPYDGGLCIGGAQYVWHHVLENDRVAWKTNVSPYLGEKYDETRIREDLKKFEGRISVTPANDLDVAHLLDKQDIVAVFQGGSESGRRALGARSILADPRSNEMKGRVNEKVKHRQWFRPFAPSILRERVGEFFQRDDDSPYMGIVLKFREDAKQRVPAVVHYDGTARLQTVSQDAGWYYKFITTWNEVSGVPIILNTSFNDREPICETPEHAINCFLGTDIDSLYFPEHGMLVRRNP